MKLATRVSAFFLIAQAMILIGNSVLLFAVARLYLYRRFDEQLQSSLNTLVAAVEVEDDDVKWEPSDHTVTLGAESGVEDIRWVVFDEMDKVVAHSRNLRPLLQDAEIIEMSRGRTSGQSRSTGWRMLNHMLAAAHPKPEEDRTLLEHAKLTVVVARNLSNLQATLNRLGGALIVLPALCWLGSALAGRWFCQHAIAPVKEMAKSVQGIQADNTLARLQVPASHDELEELGNAFNALLDQVFVGYERQRRFASDAAHQLRTPLTVLQGQVDVALRRPRSASEYEATLGVVNQEVISLRKTVESLLFLARPNDDDHLPDFQTVDLAPWLGMYLAKWKADSRWEDISAKVEDGLACSTSPGLLTQLLDILISNALKYSEPASPVEVRASNRDNALLLEVADRGIGISSDDRSSVFVPFFRARQARQSGATGTGLGLAIASRIATALGGCLRCESQPGVGSCFSLRIPNATNAIDSSAVPACFGSGTKRLNR